MIALMIALLVCGVFLVIAVLMQHGKSHGLSGTIAGGAETFFGKDKGSKIDKVLSKLTTIIGIVFVVLVLLVYLLNPNYTPSNKYTQGMGIPSTSSVE
ncbi:MAG: preprotein translocase subunit SecG [Clostridia bacterium]|nr:preprotein translocase subunit SecG [Clostridia bacterium]